MSCLKKMPQIEDHFGQFGAMGVLLHPLHLPPASLATGPDRKSNNIMPQYIKTNSTLILSHDKENNPVKTQDINKFHIANMTTDNSLQDYVSI